MIGIKWQDEDHQVLAEYAGPPLPYDFSDLAGATSACLRFIDPWGDTYFNQVQLPVLLQELETATLDAKDPQQQTALRAVSRFVEQARDQIHTYVCFVGE